MSNKIPDLVEKTPAIVREPRPDDIEARELSLIENWHRVNLESGESERFIYQLWVDDVKYGRYTSVRDMARKLGIHKTTLQDIIKSYEEKQELGVDSGVHSYTDMRETRILSDEPELRKQVLELRAKDKITRDELRQFSKIIKEHPEMAEYAIKLKEKGNFHFSLLDQ